MSLAPSRTAFDRWIAGLLDVERGFVDDALDPGGPTNWGISLRFALDLNTSGEHGHPELDVDGDGDVDAEDIRRLPRETAVAIYREQFWDFVGADRLPPRLALAVADAGVNQGRGPAVSMLQGIVGVKPDGALGPRTITAITSTDVDDVLVNYLAARALRYVTTANYTRYGKGWFRRLFKVERACLAEAGA